MHLQEIISVILYFAIVAAVGFFSYRKSVTSSDFLMGGRSMNYWLTALSAHASDMSGWLFMAYPATIFVGGMVSAWTAVGLLVGMFFNWQLIAPKIRVATEQYNSLTFSSYFESRFLDSSGLIRIFTALISLFFYTIYISAGLVALGEVMGALFGVSYDLGICIGTLILLPYVLLGGYLTLAWIDLFQGLFLMCVIVSIPLYMLSLVGGFETAAAAANASGISFSLIPDFSQKSWVAIIAAAAWGLGYFGQPHIITKFMGIKYVHEMKKSQYIGMSWMLLSLIAATAVGIVAIAYFQGKELNPELIFITMVRSEFSPFLIGSILCAVLAATINAVSSQVLVLTSIVTEDFYKKTINREASSKSLLLVSRLGILIIALIALLIAYIRPSSIFNLVNYAWSGLGASFGPLLIVSLYSKKIRKIGAWGAILSGGITAAIWPYCGKFLPLQLPSILMGFIASFAAMILLSRFQEPRATPIKTD